MKRLKRCIAIALALFLPFGVMADDGDDTLRMLLAKSDLVVLGKIVSQLANPPITKPGVMHYNCDFAVEDVLKGEPTLTNTTIKVTITRFEMEKKDHHPLIKKDARCILFLKRASPDNTPVWVTSDVWLSVQYPFPWLARSLKRVAKEK